MEDQFIEAILLTQQSTLFLRDGSQLFFPASSENINMKKKD
jgi:hypothetical protein